MLTTGMGGVLPEQPDPTNFGRILDVGCGTGGWLIETAKTYPFIETLCGADISKPVLAWARAHAQREQLMDRVQFKPMDALRVLEFPASSFDLINQRLGTSWLRTWEWTKLLVEYQRVCRPGGIIRLTEGNICIETTSSALKTLNAIALAAANNSGRLFAHKSDGLTSQLARLLTQHGIEEVQERVYTLVYRGGTPEGQAFSEDIERFYRVALPFFRKWTNVPKAYQEIYQEALKDMQKPDFSATWTVLTVWGKRRTDGETFHLRGLR
jgi:ubiquinone/menaquinone biosynthesis C-methylase UbiE